MKISEIRQQYPQYDKLSDRELADALHNKFYPEMPISDFYERVGLSTDTNTSLRDIATSFGLGATGSIKALTDVAGADNAVSRTLGKISEDLSRAYTPARQAEIERRQQLIKKAEKSGSTWEEIKANLGSVAEAPLQSAVQGLGSIVPYAVTGGVGSAAKLLPTTVKTINTLMGAAQGAGAVKSSIYDAVYEKLKEEGVSEKTAKQQALEAQQYVSKNFGQIALGAGIGAAAGRYGVESLLAPGAAKATAPGVGRRVGEALLGEMPLEGVQGGQERLASNIALQNIGRDVPTFQGVAGQAAQEAVMAGLAAGPVAAVRSPNADIARKIEEERAAEQLKTLQEEERLRKETEEAEKRKAAIEEARKTGTPELLALMGDQLQAGEYSALKTPQELDEERLAKQDELRQEQLRLEQEMRGYSTAIPALQKQMDEAEARNDMATVSRLALQLQQLATAEEKARVALDEAKKAQPKEVSADSLYTQMAEARSVGDYAKVSQIAQQLDAINKQRAAETRTIPSEVKPGEIRAMPEEQMDMFAPGYEKRQLQQDIFEIEEGFGKFETEAERKKREAQTQQQQALFTQGEEYEQQLTEREVGKQFELSPEQYAQALRKGKAPETPQKVLYRNVPIEGTTGPTRRQPYIVDAQGKAQDITDTEAARIEKGEPAISKTSVQEAIDTGMITAEVRQALGLTGFGNATLDLKNPEVASQVRNKLRDVIAAHKARAQEDLKFVNDQFTENSLYDLQGRLTPTAKDIIRRDVQAEEAQRLLNHITDLQSKIGAGVREEKTAEELTKTLHRPEVISTRLPPLEQIKTKDATELAQALGISGAADIKTTPADKISAMRHKLEARRQSEKKDAIFEQLLSWLARAKASNKPVLDTLDAKRLATLRRLYVQAALSEIAHGRAAERQPALTTTEVLQLTDQLSKPLVELSTRYLARPKTVEVTGKVQEPLIKSEKEREEKRTEEGELVYAGEKYVRTPEEQKKLDRAVGKLKSLQEELQRIRQQMKNYQQNFLEPARKKWQSMPDGLLGTPEHAAREAEQQKYLKVKEGFTKLNARDSAISEQIAQMLSDLGRKHATYGTFQKDIRSLERRPFANLPRALESIQEQLSDVITKATEPIKRQRVAGIGPMGIKQRLMDAVVAKEKELEKLKGVHGKKAERDKLVNEIAKLRDNYDKFVKSEEAKVQPPTMPLDFKERRDELDALKAKAQEAFVAKDYDTVAKSLQRMHELGLSEDMATELGTEFEDNDRVLSTAIKDAKAELEEIATGLKPAEEKEVRLGERPPPRRPLNEAQLRRVRELNKLLDSLETAYVKNKKALQDIGLFSTSKTEDLFTQDMFGEAPEKGVVFESAEKFLGSSKYGKIAKMRKAAKETVATLPVTQAELYQVRTDYVAANTVLSNLRKMGRGTLPTTSQYYNEMSGEYLRKADLIHQKYLNALAQSTKTIGIRTGETTVLQITPEYLKAHPLTAEEEKRLLESIKSNRAANATLTLYKNEEKRLRQLASEFEARAKSFLLTVSDAQLDLVSELAQAAEAMPETADAMLVAQKAVDDAKRIMDETDARVRKNGLVKPEITYTAPTEEGQSLSKTQKDIGVINAQIKALSTRMKTEAPDQRALSEFEIQNLVTLRSDLETMQFLQTAEGRLQRMTESFMEEFNTEIDPAAPLRTAFGRAMARAQDIKDAVMKQHTEEVEALRNERGTVVDALAKLARAEPPTNKQAFIAFNQDIYELRERIQTIDQTIKTMDANLTTALEVDVQMLLRADSVLKDAWAKVKAAEQALRAEDTKQRIEIAKRKAALIQAQKVVDEAHAKIRKSNVGLQAFFEAKQPLVSPALQTALNNGLGLPGTIVKRVKALSEEGAKAAEITGQFGEQRQVQTMNAGWTVRYTAEGPVFDYDPAKDPDATEDDKNRKGLDAAKAYDQLKKARSALARAEKKGTDRQIELATANLERKQKLMEDLAGARYVTVVEEMGAQPIELDATVAVQEAVMGLSKKDQNAYYKARGEQERLRKEIEHARTLVGQTEVSTARKSLRNAQDQLDSAKTQLRLLNEAWDRGTSRMTEGGYNRRKAELTNAVAQLEGVVNARQEKLRPMDAKNEERINTLTQQYFAAKKAADAFIVPKPIEATKAQRVSVAENTADMAKTMRTLQRQEKNTDVKPLVKRNQSLRSATSVEVKIRRQAIKLAATDRIAKMYPEGSPERKRVLRELVDGYIDKLTNAGSENDSGTVLRYEGAVPTNPVDADQAKKMADEFAKRLPKDVKFVYAPTLNEAPVKFLRALAMDGVDIEASAVKGGVLPDGTVVVIGNMHDSLLDLEKTILHETIGHYGVDMVLGPKGMADLTKAIRTTEGGIYGMAKALGVESDVAKTAQAWENKALAAEAKGDTEEATRLRRTGEVQAVREMLATLQERTVDESFVEKMGRYIKTILGAIRSALKSMGLMNVSNVSTNDLYYTLFQATRKMQQELAGTYMSPTGLLAMRSDAVRYANGALAEAGRTADAVIASDKNWYDSVKANGTGLAFETQLVDRFAGFERLSKTMDALKGNQMMYYLRMYDQRMNFTAQSVGNGAIELQDIVRKDGRIEHIFASKEGPSIKSVVNILKDAPAGSPEAAQRLFTLYMSAIRAKDKGLDALNFGGKISQVQLDQAMRAVESTPGLKENFDRARKEYNAYNRNLIKLLERTGAITKEVSAELVKNDDYIPWYRERNGVAELIIGKETPIRIGSIAEQPYLHELVGGDRPILDFLTSSVQNTNMIVDMALRNMATKNAVFELENIGLAKFVGMTQGPNIVKFKVEGVDKYAMIEGTRDIPGDLLVKGMEGIPTQMPVIFRALGVPARLLRKAVTAMPLYGAKQLFRDSLAAPILAGADFTPVMGAIKQIGSPTKGLLESRGITGGQIFTGTTEDLTLILKRMSENKPGWVNSLAKWEAFTMEADATTRRAQYNSYIKQGLSEMEATLMALESMNFNKRGASPSIHVISSLIPFFNAQIQSLNVLYKALFGKMPFNDRLKIQEKLLTRGMLLAASTLAYSAMMQDDEAYKNATPDQKYGNWFIRVPGVDEPVRLPIPFEVGYIFKALPEALYNSMVDKHGSEDAVKAFEQILLQTIPGGTSYGIPQALKPYVEAKLGKSFYTGRDILSAQEKGLLPEQQFRENTSEIAKSLGKAGGVSPIMIEHLVQGYTGGLGLALMQAMSMGYSAKDSPEKAYKRLSEMPVIGGAFQPNDAGAIITNMYDRMLEVQKVQNTVDDMLLKGQRSEAMALLQKRGNEYMASEMADYYTSTVRELTQYETAIRASNLSGAEKRQQLDNIRQAKIKFASGMREVADRTIPQ
jgi:hypothetical protein